MRARSMAGQGSAAGGARDPARPRRTRCESVPISACCPPTLWRRAAAQTQRRQRTRRSGRWIRSRRTGLARAYAAHRMALRSGSANKGLDMSTWPTSSASGLDQPDVQATPEWASAGQGRRGRHAPPRTRAGMGLAAGDRELPGGRIQARKAPSSCTDLLTQSGDADGSGLDGRELSVCCICLTGWRAYVLQLLAF